jgi:hypothetical protein
MNVEAHESQLKTFARIRYYHGQLLTEQSFNQEQYYFKEKLWLNNRFVNGYGVVCGLDVKLTDDGKSIYVTAGLALDKWGREIIVPCPTEPQPLPVSSSGGYGDEDAVDQKGPREDKEYVQVLICYHECLADPQPVMAGDCGDGERCTPGAVRERYRVVIKPGKAPEVARHCAVPDVIAGDQIDYAALARWITEECRAVKGDGCIPLANVRLPQPNQRCDHKAIDISVRPIVYTNDLLFELILGLLNESQKRPRGGKY